MNSTIIIIITKIDLETNIEWEAKIDREASKPKSESLALCQENQISHIWNVLLEQHNNHSPPRCIRIPDRLGGRESPMGLEGENPDIVLSESLNPCKEHQTS